MQITSNPEVIKPSLKQAGPGQGVGDQVQAVF